MGFKLAIVLGRMRATTLLAVDGPFKTSLDEGLANSHNRADIDLKGITDLLIGPAGASWGGLGFEQDARMPVGSVGEAAVEMSFLSCSRCSAVSSTRYFYMMCFLGRQICLVF